MFRSLIRLSLLLLLGAGCARVQRVPLQHDVVRLPNGRFIGPFEIPVPRRADHHGHDFEIYVVLRARCAPKLTLAFPDGETRVLGSNDVRWQALLAQRAKSQPAAVIVEPVVDPAASNAPPPSEPPPGTGPAAAPEALAAIDAELTIPLPPQRTGHWKPTRTETWPGQLEFDRARAERCADADEYPARYLNAFHESGTLALWAEVPQELLDAELEYQIVELVPPSKPPPPPIEPVAVVEVKTVAAPLPPKPRPPAPPLERESPAPPEDRSATWSPGSWVWYPAEGEWIWHAGYWLAPATRPALKVEGNGAPPNPGCLWVSGYWTWEPRGGRWIWQGGHWNPPPARSEARGEPPGEGAPWNPGYWTWSVNVYVWVAGHWGKPSPRAERAGPPPFAGARWIPGDWIFVRGTYLWSEGFYEGAERPPPARAETPPPSPVPGSIWLQGYWRWDAGRHAHEWIGGHWELPPGEGYVWVADPVGPSGFVLRGHWELRVRPVR